MAKKPTVKKNAKKQTVKKSAPVKAEVKKVTVIEQNILDSVHSLLKEGYHTTLECEGRKITIKKDTDVLSIIRKYQAMNLTGCKSGCPARAIQIR